MKVITHITSKAARGRNLTLVWGIHPFPAGKILIALSAEGLCWLGLNCGVKDLERYWPGANFVEDQKLTAKTARELAAQWPKKPVKLSVPLVLCGTAFQLKVWKELLKIKSGSTVTYAALAQKIGKPTASRAVGSAVGRNTVSVVVPCHRVVNGTGAKINYAWGPGVKVALLKGEKAA